MAKGVQEPEPEPLSDMSRKLLEHLYASVDSGQVVYTRLADRTFAIKGIKHVIYPDRRWDSARNCWQDNSWVVRKVRKPDGVWYEEAVRASELFSYLELKEPAVYAKVYEQLITVRRFQEGLADRQAATRAMLADVARYEAELKARKAEMAPDPKAAEMHLQRLREQEQESDDEPRFVQSPEDLPDQLRAFIAEKEAKKSCLLPSEVEPF